MKDAQAHLKFWPRGVPHQLTPAATSLWDNLDISARRYPDKTALQFFADSMSYAELHNATLRLAARLQQLGVKKGDRVALCMQNCPQLVIAHFAILRADAVVVPVNPMNRAEELKHYITDPDVRIAITTGDLAADWARASDELEPARRLGHLIVTQFTDAFDAERVIADLPPAWREWLLTRHALPALAGGLVHAWSEVMRNPSLPGPHQVGPDDLAILPYTSGTTGSPKGCMHLHRGPGHNAIAAYLWCGGTPEMVTLGVVPMFHVTGMLCVMHASIYAGGTIILMPRWDRDLAGQLISRHHVTSWTNIPTMVIDLLASPKFDQYDLSSLIFMGGGGAAMPQAVAQKLKDLYGLSYCEGYGLTETIAPTHTNPPDAAKQQCLGIPMMGVDARVVNPETLEEVAAAEQGEIVVCGPQVFQGYWNQPEATAQVFFERDGKRFFRTGDLGRVDEDGYYFLTDRLKRMINASGFKVWPAEVEALLYKHPAIQEACIIGVHDAYRGETVKAVVVLRATHRGLVNDKEIMDWCREHMAVYKVPRIVEFIDALPKSGSGKVMWRLLQEKEPH